MLFKVVAFIRYIQMAYDVETFILGNTVKVAVRNIIVLLNYLFNDNCGEEKTPSHVIDAIIYDFLPDIISYYESEEGQRAFEKWKAERLQKAQPQNNLCKKKTART